GDRDAGRARAARASVSADRGAERVNAPLDRLRRLVQEAAVEVRGDGSEPPAGLKVERPKRAGQGDYSTNAAMLLAPALKSSPREIAERVGAALSERLGPELRDFA